MLIDETKLPYFDLTMARPDLRDLPHFDPPEGYSFRLFEDGDEQTWAEVQTSSGLFQNVDEARAMFQTEFQPCIEEMPRRSLFMAAPNGRAVGSSTGWFNDDFLGQSWGRVHWVAMRSDAQGHGLGRPLVGATLELLAGMHERAYLETQTVRARAVRLYLDLGFLPLFMRPTCPEGWDVLARIPIHPRLPDILRELQGRLP